MNPPRWFSIHDPAKLNRSVNFVKMASRRARYSAAHSTIRGDDTIAEAVEFCHKHSELVRFIL
jgi:hypothetical protein